MHAMMPVLLAGLALAACDGPNENAGEKLDATAAATGGSRLEVGPNERVGESIDQARAAAEDAADAQAEVIRNAADVRADELDKRADQLEDQADAIRKQAEEAASTVEDRAGR